MLEQFANKVVFITGAASGIGRAFSIALARAGAHLILTDMQDLSPLKKELSGYGDRIATHPLDVRDGNAFQQLVDSTVAKHGHIDYLFNNAGVGTSGDALNFTLDDWNLIVDVNIKGVIHGLHAVYPHMRQREAGHIINISSIAGLIGGAGMAAYSASKHAVTGLTKSMQVEAAQHNITITLVCPGAINTPILTGGKYGRAIGYSAEGVKKVTDTWGPIPVEVFAEQALKRIAQKKLFILLPFKYRVIWWFLSSLPTSWEFFFQKALYRQNQRILEPHKIPVEPTKE
jgi:NAD(P)-dependent dehydrogenase (short-subunit alcohol dehydrogenase family)